MAKKEAKPGKKFKYGLETVLKVREIKEKKEQEKFAHKKKKFLKEKEKEKEIRTEKTGEEDVIRETYKKGPISDFEKVLRRHAHLGILKKDLDKQIERVIKSSKALEKQRENLIESMKDKKIIEKDKEKKLKGYKKLMQSLEIKFLDEIATQRYEHEKHQ